MLTLYCTANTGTNTAPQSPPDFLQGAVSTVLTRQSALHNTDTGTDNIGTGTGNIGTVTDNIGTGTDNIGTVTGSTNTGTNNIGTGTDGTNTAPDFPQFAC